MLHIVDFSREPRYKNLFITSCLFLDTSQRWTSIAIQSSIIGWVIVLWLLYLWLPFFLFSWVSRPPASDSRLRSLQVSLQDLAACGCLLVVRRILTNHTCLSQGLLGNFTFQSNIYRLPQIMSLGSSRPHITETTIAKSFQTWTTAFFSYLIN